MFHWTSHGCLITFHQFHIQIKFAISNKFLLSVYSWWIKISWWISWFFRSLVFSSNFYKILKIFHHFYGFFTNTHTGSKPKFGRAPELILGGNKTSILFKDFECNKTSNSNAKYHSNQNIHVQDHGSGRGRAFSKTLRFGITLLAGRSLLYELLLFW